MSCRSVFKEIVKISIFALMMLAVTELFDEEYPNPLDVYGVGGSVMLYSMKIVCLLTLPYYAFVMFASIFYNKDNWSSRLPTCIPKLANSRVCFRIVTRGDYPEMIRNNILNMLRMLKELELNNFLIEVVTGKHMDLPHSEVVRQLVVPETYKTKNNSSYKARKLQYALEDGINILNDKDWIMHLDEESILTPEAMVGIYEFASKNEYDLGHGLISYGKSKIENMLITLLESPRVAGFITLNRFCFKTLKRPLFFFVGSFILVRKGVEAHVSFDHGLEGSVAEDSYFAVRAANLGYKFGWLEGECLEEGCFCLMDYIKQRKRWCQGLYMLNRSKKIKLDMTGACFLVWYIIGCMLPLQNIFRAVLYFYPISFYRLDVFFIYFHETAFLYSSILGFFNNFNFWGLSLFQKLYCLVGSLFWLYFLRFVDSIAIIWALMSNKDQFYVVKKG